MTTPLDRRIVKQILRTDAAKLLGIAIIWQIAMTVLGLFIERGLPALVNPQAHPEASGSFTGPLAHTMRWDALWYYNIVNGSYKSDPHAAVFYPLFPLFVWLLHTLSFHVLSIVTSGLVVNTLALWVALLSLFKISLVLFKNNRTLGWCTLAAFLTFPSAFFLHDFYTEAVFCAVSFSAYYFALTRRWWIMGILLAAATATRITSVLVVGLCFLEFARCYDWNIRKILNWNILWFCLAPLGIIFFSLFLFAVHGDALAMFHGYDLWSYQKFNPNIFKTLHDSLTIAIHRPPEFTKEAIVVNFLLPLLCLLILFVASVFLIWAGEWGIPLGVMGLLSIVMFTLNSNLISVHRYVLPCVMVYLAMTELLRRYRKAIPLFATAIWGGTILQTLLYVLYIGKFFAG